MTPAHPISIYSFCVRIKLRGLTASRAGTSVAGLLGLLVSTLAEVVGAGVDDDGALCFISVAVWVRGRGEEVLRQQRYRAQST